MTIDMATRFSSPTGVREEDKDILGLGIGTLGLGLLKLLLKEGDTVVEGDGLLLLGRDLGLGGSKLGLGTLGAGNGGIGLSADRGNFLIRETGGKSAID